MAEPRELTNMAVPTSAMAATAAIAVPGVIAPAILKRRPLSHATILSDVVTKCRTDKVLK